MLHSSAACLEGSSPHTRGAHRIGCVVSVAVRIIPAYAGSTSGEHLTGRAPADHPRIRGEHAANRHDESPKHGSSPHTRGAPFLLRLEDDQGGIIPAYAGSTHGRSTARGGCSDHPRIRGEHRVIFINLVEDLGSSPHTRGAPLLPRAHDRHVGIIPAYAGSTLMELALTRDCRDHPRIRGEHRER